jgi:hypothetical protein
MGPLKLIFFNVHMSFINNNNNNKKIPYEQFLSMFGKDNMRNVILNGFLFIMASQNESSYIPTKFLSHTSNDYQQDIAQQLPHTNSSEADKDTNNQIPESMMGA